VNRASGGDVTFSHSPAPPRLRACVRGAVRCGSKNGRPFVDPFVRFLPPHARVRARSNDCTRLRDMTTATKPIKTEDGGAGGSASAGCLSPPPASGTTRPTPETCLVTLCVPLPKGHEYSTNSPNIFRFEVKFALKGMEPTELERAVTDCVLREDTPVLFLRDKKKPYKNKYYEFLSTQIKAALEQAECTDSETSADDESESDFSDDDAAEGGDDNEKSKRRKLNDDSAATHVAIPIVRELKGEHVTRSYSRNDDGTYKRNTPVPLKPTQVSLNIFWEPNYEEEEDSR